MTSPPSDVASAVLEWFDRHGRTHLPWQQGITPYRVWVSEIMLQQTQVATVIDYYQRFIAALPDVRQLAAAPEDEVLHLWTGLGYYSRARNLHRTARIIVEHFGGEFPRSVEQLAGLPGIGRSTAGAIASIALQLRAPILDGNVKRVLARYLALSGYPGEAAISRQLWEAAEQLMPEQRIAHYTQAMMDLGATVCTRRQPACLLCPLQTGCQAHLQGLEEQLPTPKPRKVLPQKQTLMPLLTRQDRHILLQRRPACGLWGGLWSLPELDSPGQLQDLADRHALQLGRPLPLPGLTHTFSHFRLMITPLLVPAEPQAAQMAEEGWLWYNLDSPPRLGLATPIKKLLKLAASQLDSGELP